MLMYLLPVYGSNALEDSPNTSIGISVYKKSFEIQKYNKKK